MRSIENRAVPVDGTAGGRGDQEGRHVRFDWHESSGRWSRDRSSAPSPSASPRASPWVLSRGAASTRRRPSSAATSVASTTYVGSGVRTPMRCRTAIRRSIVSQAGPLDNGTAHVQTVAPITPFDIDTAHAAPWVDPNAQAVAPVTTSTSTHARARGESDADGVAHHAVRHRHSARGPVGGSMPRRSRPSRRTTSNARGPVGRERCQSTASHPTRGPGSTRMPVTRRPPRTLPGGPAGSQLLLGFERRPGDWAAFGMPSRRGDAPARLRYPSRLVGP